MVHVNILFNAKTGIAKYDVINAEDCTFEHFEYQFLRPSFIHWINTLLFAECNVTVRTI